MARDVFTETLTYVDPTSSALKPLNNASVTVYLAGTTTKATLYAARDPNNGTQIANPLTTGATGLVEFWIDAGEYDIAIADQNLPARVGAKTIGFNSLPAAAGGIPSSRIAGDGGLAYNALDAVAKRQDIPIGGVIDWWRPAASVPVPTGFVICDGSAVTAANHEFPGISTTINVPDLRNAFVLGANVANNDGTGATAGEEATNAPGIGGTGGTNLKNLSHVHGMGAHTHTIAHTHTYAHTHDHAHTHELVHTHSYAHTHTMPHTHDLSNHTHTISHTHDVPPHYHGSGTLAIGSSGGHTHPVSINDPGHRHAIESYNAGAEPIEISVGPHGVGVGRSDASGGGSGRGFRIFTDGAFMATFGVGSRTTGITASTNSADHSHPNSTFTGVVGNSGGGLGDAWMTTSAASAGSSGTPSTNTSGGASTATTATQSTSTTGGASTTTTSQPSSATTTSQSTTTTSAPSAASSGAPSVADTDSALSATFDIKPKYVGLLKIMKVRRN